MGPRRCPNQILWRRKNCQEMSFYFFQLKSCHFRPEILPTLVRRYHFWSFLIIFAWNWSKYEFDKFRSAIRVLICCNSNILKQMKHAFEELREYHRLIFTMFENLLFNSAEYFQLKNLFLFASRTVQHCKMPDFEFRRFPGEIGVFFLKIYYV